MQRRARVVHLIRPWQRDDGRDSLLADGKTLFSYDYNVAVTRRVGEMSHTVGMSVAGELGCLGPLETGDAGEEDGICAEGKLSHEQMLTDPVQAKAFVTQTGVDALAILNGSSSVPQGWFEPPFSKLNRDDAG